jgi:hypothetical protein
MSAFSNRYPRRELAHRVSGGIEVTLYWSVEDHTTSVEIFDDATEETFYFGVPHEHALDAFYHPFAHASFIGT